jgi:hypothetical protein
MIIHIRHIETKQEATAIPAFVTPAPKGMMVGKRGVVEKDGHEYIVDVRNYELYYKGTYVNLYYAAREGFLDPSILRTERKNYQRIDHGK